MFNKPYDIVWVFAIAGLVIATMGFGIDAVIGRFGGEPGDSLTFINTTKVHLVGGGAYSLGNTSESATESLTGQQGEEASEAGFITRGFQSMISLGDTFIAVEQMMSESSSLFNLDSIYWMVIAGAIIITLFVVVYTWVRGS